MMKLIKSMMISCRKASFLISKKEERKLTMGERIHLAMHRSMCEFCKAFEKQSELIVREAKHFHPVTDLSPEAKAQIIEAFRQK